MKGCLRNINIRGLTLPVTGCYKQISLFLAGGAVAQLGARLDGIEEVVGSNPIGSTNFPRVRPGDMGDTTSLRHG
jgi:hypothetical protein